MKPTNQNDLNQTLDYRLPDLGAETVRPIIIVTAEPVHTLTVIGPRKKAKAKKKPSTLPVVIYKKRRSGI